MNKTTHPLPVPSARQQPNLWPRLAWPAFILILVSAAFLRFYMLETIPPGMPIDESVDAEAVRAIAGGWRPIFIPQGWGREPLYHYIAALLFVFVHDRQMTIRLTSAMLGILLVPAIGALTIQVSNRRAGVLAAAFTAITYWAVFASRYGVRDILSPLLSTFTLIAFWQALQPSHQYQTLASALRLRGDPRACGPGPQASGRSSPSAGVSNSKFALAGVLLGLTFYTKQSSRIFPLLFMAVGLWLWRFDRERFCAVWRGMLLFFVVGLIVGAPLFAYLLIHPDAESGRAFMLEPLQGLRNGDFSPLVTSVLAALGAFSFDAGGWHTNVPGHPVFPLVTGTLFYLGLVTCLLRWRDMRRFALPVWLLVGLLPAMVTSGLHYFRMIGALAPAMILPAIGLVDAGDWLARRFVREQATMASAIILATVGSLAVSQSAVTTWRDYFQTWAINPAVRDLHDANLREIARYLDRSTDTTPAFIASVAAEDTEPDRFGTMLERADVDHRWFDASTALVLPSGTQTARYIFRPETPLRNTLADYFAGAQLVIDQHWPDGPSSFKVYRLEIGPARQAAQTNAAWPLDASRPTRIAAPVRFSDRVELLGYAVPLTITQGSNLRLLTTWHVLRSVTPGPSGIFVHLLDAEGQIVAQDDHLGFPRHGWRTDDLFIQFSRLELAPDLLPARYTLQVGWYDKDTQARWPMTDAQGLALGDHLVLGQLAVTGR